MAMQKAAKAESGVTFGEKPSFSSAADIFQYAGSDDGKTFTISFSALQISLGSTKAPAPIAAKTFSVVLPLGGYAPIKAAIITQGFAIATEGANGTLVVTVNGDARVFRFGPSFENSFVHEFEFAASGLSELRMTWQLLIERDSASPDAAGDLTVSTVDGNLALAPKKG